MSEAPTSRPWPPHSDQEYRQMAAELVDENLLEVFGQVKLMVFDADGVLTSGRLVYGAEGETLKEFHSHDGLGLVMARIVGIDRAVLTGRNSEIVARRCRELRFDSIKLGRFDKVAALNEILTETGHDPKETLYMGDDLIDLPAMYEVGLPVAVPAAPPEVRRHCRYVTSVAGGVGAVREVTDLVLRSAGLYGLALQRLVDKTWHPTQQELSADGKHPGTEDQTS